MMQPGDFPRWIDNAKLSIDKDGYPTLDIEGKLPKSFVSSRFLTEMIRANIPGDAHVLDSGDAPLIMATVEFDDMPEKGYHILFCGCQLPLDVDVDKWLEENKVEHLARHGIQHIE